MVGYKEFTLGEFIDAIEKNGLKQAMGSYFRNKRGFALIPQTRGTIGSACAIGQGVINLGIDPDHWGYDGDYDNSRTVNNIRSYIYDMNDAKGYTLDRIATVIRKDYPDALNIKIKAPIREYKVASSD